ncbi:hypothetical protein [Arsukibacterium perlucidum]|uniref:hypothetical protein n=1 Tax=Arsukibacterium perlucidum TaxID=368811 RepID=UPI00039A709C|nr:hypothetical protein [Arsukibacterium perlucidum]
MIEKEYYRLDELAHLGVTEGTIRYFIEQDKLTPAFFVPSKWYVIGGYIKGMFNGFAIAKYQGLVSFPKSQNNELLAKGKVWSNSVSLLWREKIIIDSSDYPFNIPCPNSYIEAWQKRSLEELHWDRVPAKFYPQVRILPQSEH